MSNPLTPERVKELQDAVKKLADSCGTFGIRSTAMTVGELRTLLTFYAKRSGVCRWDEMSWAGSIRWTTDCGRRSGVLSTDRPCWCGRQVEVVR